MIQRVFRQEDYLKISYWRSQLSLDNPSIKEMQSEIKEMQIENRRIIERVFEEDDSN